MAEIEMPDPIRSQAVLIAVSDHTDLGLPSYPALETGARALARLLQREDIWGVPEEHCHVVTGEEATQTRISEVLIDAAEKAEDALVVYYGGHGVLDRHGTRTRLLLAQREASSRHRLNWRDFDWLRSHLQHGSPMARHRILLLDSCHSGEAVTQGVLDSAAGQWEEDDRENLSTLITSCEKFERAQVPESERCTVFMSALIDVISTGIDEIGDVLTPKHLWDELKKHIGGRQTPRMLCADGAGSIPIFKNRLHVATPPSADSAPGKATIPLPPQDLIGRDTEVEAIVAGARKAAKGEGPFVVIVHGRGGAGKSAIVQQAAVEVSTDFPEWQLFVNLHTWTPGQLERSPANLLEELLYQARQTDIPPDLASRADRWRNWLAEHRALVVLDDVADPDPDQVQEALPPIGSRCALLLTSRRPLARTRTSLSIEAKPLSEPDAIELLRSGTNEPITNGDLGALANSVARIPKALDALRYQLANVRPDLLLRRIEDAGSHALDTIYREALLRLESDALRNTACACGFHPGPDFDASSIAVITGADEYTTADHLHQLVEHRLIKALPHYRFQLHDEDAKFAPVIAGQLVPGGLEVAEDRLMTWMRLRVGAAVRELWGHDPRSNKNSQEMYSFAGPGDANKWLGGASAEILAGTLAAIRIRHSESEVLADCFARWLHLTNRYDLSAVVLTHLLDNSSLEGQAKAAYGLGRAVQSQGRWEEAAGRYGEAQNLALRSGEKFNLIDPLFGLGEIARLQGRSAEAEDRYKEAVDIARETGDRVGQAKALNGLGTMARLQGRWSEAEDHYLAALDIARQTGDRIDQANALNRLGTIARLQDRLPESEGYFRGALKIALDIGSRYGQGSALNGIGTTAGRQGRWREAEQYSRDALEIALDTGDRVSQAIALRALGEAARLRGHWSEAKNHYQSALDLCAGTDDRTGQAMALEGLGWTHKENHETDAARSAFLEAHSLYRDLGWIFFAEQCQRALSHLR